MSPGPDDRRSTGATVTIIAAVVVCLFVLGALILVGLGLVFFTVRGSPMPQPVYAPVEVQTSPAVEAVREPLPTPEPTEAGSVTEPDEFDDPTVSGESTQAVDEAAEPEMPEEVAEPGTATAETPLPTTTRLATLTPSETLSISVGDAPLVRSVDIDGQTTASVLWAQPSDDQGVSQLAYSLGKRYVNLKGIAAISDAAEAEDAETPSATFNIYGDGNLLWTSDAVKGYGVSSAFDISVEGINLLTLVVESDSSSKASRCVWANLELTPVPSE